MIISTLDYKFLFKYLTTLHDKVMPY